MLFDGDKRYSPLTCIGENIEGIGCICVSPEGGVAIFEKDPFVSGESSEEFLSRISAIISRLQLWTHDDLDRIASEHFLKTNGQAALVIDAMTLRGYLTYASKSSFQKALDNCLKSGKILVAVAVGPLEIDMRTVEFSTGIIGNSDIVFSLIRSDLVSKFLSN